MPETPLFVSGTTAKAADMNALRDDASRMIAVSGGEVTISAGVIALTVTDGEGFYTVDTEGDAASDDLNTINGTSDGDIVVLTAENAARITTLKHGIGNLALPYDADIDLRADSAVILRNKAGTLYMIGNKTPRRATITVAIGNGLSTITTGIAGHIYLPQGMNVTITGWRISTHDNTAGSIVVDLWHDVSRAAAAGADSICLGNEPYLSGQTERAATDLSGWTKTRLQSGCIVFNVDSASGLEQVTLTLDCIIE